MQFFYQNNLQDFNLNLYTILLRTESIQAVLQVVPPVTVMATGLPDLFSWKFLQVGIYILCAPGGTTCNISWLFLVFK